MVRIRNLLKTWQRPNRDTKKLSLESRQTGSCGGMSTTELKIRIELILDGVDTTKIIEPVTELAALSHAIQSEFLTQLSEVATLSVKHAYSLMLIYTSALNLMSTSEHALWLDKIKESLIEKDLTRTDSLLNNYSDFTSQLSKSKVQFEDVSDILEKLISAISNRDIAVCSLDGIVNALPYTDGQKLYIPHSIDLFDTHSENLMLYKVIAFHLFGQIEWNTWLGINRLNQAILNEKVNFLADFSLIETLRINWYLKRTFPGIWNNILYLHNKWKLPPYPDAIFSGYEFPSVYDSLEIACSSDTTIAYTQPLPYQGSFSPENILLTESIDPAEQPALIHIKDEGLNEDGDFADDINGSRITLNNKVGALSVNNLADNNPLLWNQLNEMIDSHLEQKEQSRDEEKKKNVFLYPEWDISLKQFRRDWCRVEEIPLPAEVNCNFSMLNLKELRFSDYQIKKTLDMIINSQKHIRHQTDGDEIDIDAWVEANSNRTKQVDDFQRVYIRNNKNNRSVAIMFAVDISGSTAGWKSEIIQQSIWLLSRTLSKMQDQYAIYAFSGTGRHQCEVFPVKKFHENNSEAIKQRIASLKARQYTRMGAAVRHMSKILNQSDAKTKILFVLTDGKPDDIDSYRGHYGVEDTKQAFNEAKALHLNPFVLTFDHEGIEYLPYMLGKNRYRLISNISMLPIQISTIYRQLTS